MGGRGSISGFSNTPAVREALEYYVSGDGMWLNKYLRDTENFEREYGGLSSEERQILRDLDTGTGVSIGSDMTLYRSVDASAIFGNISDLDYENLVSKVVYGHEQKITAQRVNSLISRTLGKSITEKGFMSTTTEASIAHDWGGFSGSSKPVVLEFSAPKTTRGANLTKHSMAQSEMLLHRGTKYTIKEITAKNGNIYIKADINK